MEVVDHVGPGLLYSFPVHPIRLVLPGGLRPGTEVSIQGTTPSGASGFAINFQQGLEKASPVAFHFNARFSEGPVVVRNSRLEGSWLQEERTLVQTEFPFAHKKDFRLVITPTQEWFSVVVNGKHLLNFNHRLPLDTSTHLVVYGDIFVKSIYVPIQFPALSIVSIPGNLKIGDTICVHGKVNPNAAEFTVNLQVGNESCDVGLHVNPRFGQGEVVRNTCINGEWGSEEKQGGLGPVVPGENLDLVISVGIEHYVIWLNGVHFTNYDHRLPVDSVGRLSVHGDITLDRVIVDGQPTFLHELFESREIVSSDFQVHIVHPTIPARVPVPGSLGKGTYVLVIFVPKPSANRFSINLQNGSGEDGDVLLHVNPRWGDVPKPMIVLNSRTGGTWGEEVLPGHFPLKQGQLSDLVVHNMGDHFRVALNGHHLLDFPNRLDPAVADTVTVHGDVTIQRILVI